MECQLCSQRHRSDVCELLSRLSHGQRARSCALRRLSTMELPRSQRQAAKRALRKLLLEEEPLLEAFEVLATAEKEEEWLTPQEAGDFGART